MNPDANLSGFVHYGIALVSFGLILIPTGYVISWSTDLLGIRRRPTQQQLSISILAATAVWPMVAYYVERFLPIAAIEMLVITNIFAAGFLFWRSGGHSSIDLLTLSKTVVVWGIVAFAVIALLVDIQFDGSLQMTAAVNDYALRVSVTDAISRTGIPPANPSYYDHHPLPLYYYYFWFLLCSMADYIGGMIAGPLACVRASVFWSIAALVSLFHCIIFLDIFRLPEGLQRHWGRLVALSLLIMGLDLPMNILIVLRKALSQHTFVLPVALEWWNYDQISPWLPTLFWVPHHAAAAIIAMFCFIMLRAAREDVGLRERRGLFLTASIGFASVLGTSVWIGLVVASIVLTWMIFSGCRRWHVEIWSYLAVGVVSLVIVSPFILDLLNANHLPGTPIVLEVRRFYFLNPVEHHLFQLVGDGWSYEIFVSSLRLLFLPLNYFLELGFFLLGGIVYVRWWRRNQFALRRDDWFWIVAFVVPILVCSLLKSSIRNNDLGWRGFLIPNILLVMASLPMLASLLGEISSTQFLTGLRVRVFAAVLAVLGLAGTAYEAMGLRLGNFDRHFSFGNASTRYRAAQMEAAYAWLARSSPRNAIVLHNPTVEFEIFHALYGHRQTILSDHYNGTLCGINDSMYNKLAVPLGKLFSDDATEEDFGKIPGSFDVDFVVVTASDPIWSRASSWVWQSRPVYANSYVRIFKTSMAPR
jgi:hypothetical protein